MVGGTGGSTGGSRVSGVGNGMVGGMVGVGNDGTGGMVGRKFGGGIGGNGNGGGDMVGDMVGGGNGGGGPVGNGNGMRLHCRLAGCATVCREEIMTVHEVAHCGPCGTKLRPRSILGNWRQCHSCATRPGNYLPNVTREESADPCPHCDDWSDRCGCAREAALMGRDD